MNNESEQVITHVMEPVLPGAYCVLTVGGGCETTAVYAAPLQNTPSTHPGDGEDVRVGRFEKLEVVQRTEECFTVDIPLGDLALTAMQTAEAADPASVWYAHRPRVNWCYPGVAIAGEPFRVMGRNLVRVDLYPPADKDSPVSFGGLIDFTAKEPAANSTRACIRPEGGVEYTALEVLKASSYEAHLTLPQSLPPGRYELHVHNGLGGPAGWSEPCAIEVAAADPWPDTVFEIDQYAERHEDIDDAFAAALSDMADAGGGVLLLGPYTYIIHRTLVMPPRSVLRGAGRQRTMLSLPFHPATGAEPPFVAITGDRDFAVEDLRIEGVHAPLLICAPQFTPATQDEAARDFAAIGLSERRARNVAIRRCFLEQNPLRHMDRRKDFDPRGWFKALGESGWTKLPPDHFACISFKGDGLVVEDCTVLGGGGAIGLSRCTYARISRNKVRAGFLGMGIACTSSLTWGEGGAKIKGNETRRLIIEDNDVAVRSDMARGLIVFNRSGDQLHVARNHIHDIAPNTDSEALLTHLWQARWKEPTIRMTGPTTAEIVDPTGEVTNECLDHAWLDIVEGRGVGQLRQIVKREGNAIEIDRPWRADPDETSNIVFTAPAPFRDLTITDNRVVAESVSIIIWGTSHNVMIDGNHVAEGRGIGIWSIRLAADQKVWGGAFFVSVINNVADRCHWPTPERQPQLRHAVGMYNVLSQAEVAITDGYDFLGLIMRGNHTVNNTGIGFRKTFARASCREAGVVIEDNFVADAYAGIVLENNTRLVQRGNGSRNVQHPLTWLDA